MIACSLSGTVKQTLGSCLLSVFPLDVLTEKEHWQISKFETITPEKWQRHKAKNYPCLCRTGRDDDIYFTVNISELVPRYRDIFNVSGCIQKNCYTELCCFFLRLSSNLCFFSCEILDSFTSTVSQTIWVWSGRALVKLLTTQRQMQPVTWGYRYTFRRHLTITVIIFLINSFSIKCQKTVNCQLEFPKAQSGNFRFSFIISDTAHVLVDSMKLRASLVGSSDSVWNPQHLSDVKTRGGCVRQLFELSETRQSHPLHAGFTLVAASVPFYICKQVPRHKSFGGETVWECAHTFVRAIVWRLQRLVKGRFLEERLWKK